LTFHARVVSPAGQLYHCEHNHRTETAAVTCANSSATRQMAALAWQRSAAQAARAEALAERHRRERAEAQARRIAAQEAEIARLAAARKAEAERLAKAQVAAAEAKAAKRAAKLAAMAPRRAWKQMTEEERLLKTAELELQIYGMIITAEASAAYDKREGAKGSSSPPRPSQGPPAPALPARRVADVDGEPWWKQPGLRT
jgi:colicin import membrane protein